MIDVHRAVAPTYLFCPGNRPERFAKAASAGAPVILDLEDAVPPPEKDSARAAVLERLSQPDEGATPGPHMALRINDVYSEWGLRDVHALAHMPAVRTHATVVLPKAGHAKELRWLYAHLRRSHPGWHIVALIETLEGLRNAREIAACPGVAALGFGAADLASQLGVDNAWEPLLFARAQVLAAAAEQGIPALDVPALDIHDEVGLRLQCERAKVLGFRGKFAIHPRQVRPILEAFRPSAQALARARAVCAAFEAASGQACQLDGQMIDLPLYAAAKNLLLNFPNA